MDTALAQKFPFILDRNLVKANCTENHVCTSCDTVVLGSDIFHYEDSKTISVCLSVRTLRKEITLASSISVQH